MSAPSMPSPIGSRRPAVSAQARELAARLSELLVEDQAIAVRQADSQRRLSDANDRLRLGLAPAAPIYDPAAPAGDSGPASQTTLLGALQATHWTIQGAFCAYQSAFGGGRPPPPAGGGAKPPLLGALQATHWTIRGAFCAYQSACEERRQLAAEVGETIRQFLDALLATGWSEDQAQNANVHELASAIGDGETKR